MIEEKPEVECHECWWQGDSSEILYNDETGRYNVCPQCLEVDCIYDYEEE